MSDEQRKDTEAYLARIRKTIADSERLVESARLRMAETDRMLEKQGLTREQVLNFRFSPEQREAVNRELVRRGLEPIEDDETWGAGRAPLAADELAERREAEAASAWLEPGAASSGDAELENRQRKFGMMMKPFQL